MAQDKPGFMEKMKDMVTGHKPGQGTGKAGSDVQQEKYDTGRPLSEGEKAAIGAPQPEKKHGFMEKAKEKLPGTDEHEVAKAGTTATHTGTGAGYGGAPGATYPTTTTTGATYTDATGYPVEGPRAGASPRKEGLMDKVKDKLHMGGHKDDHRADTY